MEQWDRKQKVAIGGIFMAILLIVGIVAGMLTNQQTHAGMKHFKVEVTSERDNYSEMKDCESEEEFLGAYMRTFAGCEWQDSEYGIYIKGFDGMGEDMENQYWWCVMVNGESTVAGADGIPLQEGDTYSFVLMQGW